MNYLIIKQKLCSLNEYIKACRSNRYIGAKLKAQIEEGITWDIKKAVSARQLYAIDCPVDVLIDFYQDNARMDVDNKQSSTKFILDALVKNGILKDDSQKYVKQIYHRIFKSQTKESYTIVSLYEAGKIKLTFE